MDRLAQTVGIGLVLLALQDIYLTVLYPRLGRSVFSMLLSKGIWWLFKLATRTIPFKGDRLLSHSGPIILVSILVVWLSLLIFGFALIVWPALGSTIQASQGETPTDFGTALYYSGFSLTTLGTGDLVPKTDTQRLLMFVQAAIGFSIFTLTITYLLSVYSAFVKRNSFALSLHHRTVGTGDAAELLARMGANGQLNDIQQNIATMARDVLNVLVESHNSYPVVLYFRFQQTYYSLPRIVLLNMDTATLIKSALNSEKYRSLICSAAVAELWGGSLHFLHQLSHSFLPPRGRLHINAQQEQAWRERYYRAVERLKAEGIETVADLEEGANSYISLRRKWQPDLTALSAYMAYKWSEVAPNDFEQ